FPSGSAAERRRQQHRSAAGSEMSAQHCFQQLRHIMVGSVDLVDDKQAAIETNRAEVGMRRLYGGQQRLVDGSYSDGSCEESFRMLGCPSPLSVAEFRIVLPPIRRLFIGKQLSCGDRVHLRVSWYGEHRNR